MPRRPNYPLAYRKMSPREDAWFPHPGRDPENEKPPAWTWTGVEWSQARTCFTVRGGPGVDVPTYLKAAIDATDALLLAMNAIPPGQKAKGLILTVAWKERRSKASSVKLYYVGFLLAPRAFFAPTLEQRTEPSWLSLAWIDRANRTAPPPPTIWERLK